MASSKNVALYIEPDSDKEIELFQKIQVYNPRDPGIIAEIDRVKKQKEQMKDTLKK